MDEKIREAIRQGVADGFKTWRDEQDSGLPVQRIMDAIEAKLSPKYPPPLQEGGIYVVRNDEWPSDEHILRYYIGGGKFCDDNFGKQDWPDAKPYDHYRRIVTAEEALDAIDEAFKHGGTLGVMEAYDYLRGIVKSLIDNAERG